MNRKNHLLSENVEFIDLHLVILFQDDAHHYLCLAVMEIFAVPTPFCSHVTPLGVLIGLQKFPAELLTRVNSTRSASALR